MYMDNTKVKGTLGKLIVGPVIHSVALDKDMQIIDMALLGVTPQGTIAFCKPISEVVTPTTSSTVVPSVEQPSSLVDQAIKTIQQSWTVSNENILLLKDGQFLIPGFIDTHIHAPQYVFSGTGLDLPLLDWLNKYTFPREAKFADEPYARAAYARVVHRCLRAGTTTACYYGTIHLPASKILTDIILDEGQRAFIGKVNMDRHSPDYYTETTEASHKETEEFVEYVLSKKSDLVAPVLTPRFVPSCTSELMKYLGDLAAKYNGLPIQSHLSENDKEIAWVKELHPDANSYTDVYYRHGLLTNRSVMAHCVHLTDDERALIKKSGAGVSHCASSNFSLESGVLNVRRLLDEGIKVGLGTDVAGGYHHSILDAIRQSMTASKVVASRSREQHAAGCAVSKAPGAKIWKALTVSEAFYLATMGGAQVMALEDKIGNFMEGKDFDALLIDVHKGFGVDDQEESKAAADRISKRLPGLVDMFPHDDITTSFEKFLFLGDDRNITRVWVKGREVGNTN